MLTFLRLQHHGAPGKLADQIEEHEEEAKKPDADPRSTDVIPLFIPLKPHPNAILEECTYQAESSHMR